MKTHGLILTTALLFPAVASATGDGALKKLDEAINRYDDMTLSYDVVDHQPGKADRKLAIDVKVKGDKRFTRFTAPADLKGTRVLILSQTQMYVYLPAFKKVRRIASHVTRQGFMGTCFSNDDMALTTFADKYTGKLLEDGPTAWRVEAIARPGTDAPYPKLVVTIRKKDSLPLQIEYFNDEGARLKTETREGYDCEGNICTAAVHKMVDHTAKDRWTKLVRTTWKVNPGLSSRMFTKRSLQRGH